MTFLSFYLFLVVVVIMMFYNDNVDLLYEGMAPMLTSCFTNKSDTQFTHLILCACLSYICVVSEYLGEFMSQEENNRRKEKCYKRDVTVLDKLYTYTLLRDLCPNDRTSFRVHDGKSKLSTIDATRVGNCSRYISHSCNPNLVAVQIIRPEKPPRIVFIAKRDIQRGEQLTIDYNPEEGANNTLHENESLLDDYNPMWKRQARHRDKDALICYCGDRNCRKIVYFAA